jgi:hypothetical protein
LVQDRVLWGALVNFGEEFLGQLSECQFPFLLHGVDDMFSTFMHAKTIEYLGARYNIDSRSFILKVRRTIHGAFSVRS